MKGAECWAWLLLLTGAGVALVDTLPFGHEELHDVLQIEVLFPQLV